VPAYPPAEYLITAAVADAAAAALVRLRRRDLTRLFVRPLTPAVLYLAFSGGVYAAGTAAGVDPWFRTALGVFVGVAGGWVGLLLALHLAALVVLGAAGRRGRARLHAAYLECPDPTVRWTFTDAGFTTRLADQTRDVSWAAVKAVAEVDGFWIVSMADEADEAELFLPREAVADETAALLRAKAGG
jgi:hypothetical protein